MHVQAYEAPHKEMASQGTAYRALGGNPIGSPHFVRVLAAVFSNTALKNTKDVKEGFKESAVITVTLEQAAIASVKVGGGLLVGGKQCL
jgi:hypothetical protein